MYMHVYFVRVSTCTDTDLWSICPLCMWSAGVQQADQSVLVQKLRVTTVETLKQAKELGSKGNISVSTQDVH